MVNDYMVVKAQNVVIPEQVVRGIIRDLEGMMYRLPEREFDIVRDVAIRLRGRPFGS